MTLYRSLREALEEVLPQSFRCPYMIVTGLCKKILWRFCEIPHQEVLAIRFWRSSALVLVWKFFGDAHWKLLPESLVSCSWDGTTKVTSTVWANLVEEDVPALIAPCGRWTTNRLRGEPARRGPWYPFQLGRKQCRASLQGLSAWLTPSPVQTGRRGGRQRIKGHLPGQRAKWTGASSLYWHIAWEAATNFYRQFSADKSKTWFAGLAGSEDNGPGVVWLMTNCRRFFRIQGPHL